MGGLLEVAGTKTPFFIDHLRRMIEYLNAVTLPQVQVLAFELARVRDRDVEILLPRVFGAELALAKSSPGAQPSWTESDFFGWLEEHEPDLAPSVHRFVEEAKQRGLLVANGTAQSPSLILGLNAGEATLWALSLFTAGQNALKVQFRLERFNDKGLDGRPAAERLAKIPDQNLDMQALAALKYRKWIYVGFDALDNHDIRNHILDALETAHTAESMSAFIEHHADTAPDPV